MFFPQNGPNGVSPSPKMVLYFTRHCRDHSHIPRTIIYGNCSWGTLVALSLCVNFAQSAFDFGPPPPPLLYWPQRVREREGGGFPLWHTFQLVIWTFSRTPSRVPVVSSLFRGHIVLVRSPSPMAQAAVMRAHNRAHNKVKNHTVYYLISRRNLDLGCRGPRNEEN